MTTTILPYLVSDYLQHFKTQMALETTSYDHQVAYMLSCQGIDVQQEDNKFKTSSNTTATVNCTTALNLKCQRHGCIESSANPRWDAGYHDYAHGLNVLIDINGAGDRVDVFTTGDRNEWGRFDKRYTRHLSTGIPGANGKARFSHKPCCGLLQSNYQVPLRYAPLELEFTIVND